MFAPRTSRSPSLQKPTPRGLFSVKRLRSSPASRFLSMRNSFHPAPVRHPAVWCLALKVVNRTMICVSLSTTLAGWTTDKDYVGPLKVKVLSVVCWLSLRHSLNLVEWHHKEDRTVQAAHLKGVHTIVQGRFDSKLSTAWQKFLSLTFPISTHVICLHRT